jgi:hypothetical protein
MVERGRNARNKRRQPALAWPWSARLHRLAVEARMLAIIAVVLVVLWALGFFAFHVTSAFIHIVLVIAVIVLVLHFLRGRSV